MPAVPMLVVAVAFVAPAPRDALRPTFFPHARGSKWEYRRSYSGRVKPLVVRVGEVTKHGRLTEFKFTGDFEYLGFEERMQATSEGVMYRGTRARGEKPFLIRAAVKAGER